MERALIPQTIHRIWIGPTPSPHENLVNGWKDFHPDFKFQFWGENHPDLKKYLDEAIHLFGGLKQLEGYSFTYMTDLLRLLILRDEGGIYLDHDYRILKSLTPLIENKEFVGTFQYDPKNLDKDIIFARGLRLQDIVAAGYSEVLYESPGTVNNCFIACISGHPIILMTIEILIENHFKESKERLPVSDWTVGPYTLTAAAQKFGLRTFESQTNEYQGAILYHRDYLHPLRGAEREGADGDSSFYQKLEKILSQKSSYAVHIQEHFGAKNFLSKKGISFSDWFKRQYL